MLFYNGRPDGLGNRIEELINLEAYCIKNNTMCVYYWNNKFKGRTYKIYLECTHIIIQDRGIYNDLIAFKLKNYGDFSHDEMIEAASNIKLRKDIDIKTFIPSAPYTSVHIRSTDKLLNRGDHEFTLNFFIEKLEKTIVYLNDQLDKGFVLPNICICADDERYRNEIIKRLNSRFIVIEPFKEMSGITNDYKDFFSLVYSQQIIMVPKFSSFATTACLIGNNQILCHIPKDFSCLVRYRCNLKMIE